MIEGVRATIDDLLKNEKSSMPKMKTKRAAAKRYRVKPSGKIKHDRANHEHIATKKSKDRKNSLKKASYVQDCDRSLVTRCLPYG